MLDTPATLEAIALDYIADASVFAQEAEKLTDLADALEAHPQLRAFRMALAEVAADKCKKALQRAAAVREGLRCVGVCRSDQKAPAG